MKNFEHDTIIKKTGLLCVGLLFVFFSACEPEDTGETENIVKTTLTISNNSSVTFNSLNWNGTEWGGYPGYGEEVDKQIKPGNKQTKDVDAGSGYIFFEVVYWDFYGDTASGRTNDVINIEKKEAKTFVFTDSTLVVDNSNNTYTLSEFVQRQLQAYR
ncbi:MAG: hypothetical protein LBP19_09540 [Treponema sp.]|jgi:hypothetical protein|nr:hypothetical protein [Treponema sp.]